MNAQFKMQYNNKCLQTATNFRHAVFLSGKISFSFPKGKQNHFKKEKQKL